MSYDAYVQRESFQLIIESISLFLDDVLLIIIILVRHSGATHLKWVGDIME